MHRLKACHQRAGRAERLTPRSCRALNRSGDFAAVISTLIPAGATPNSALLATAVECGLPVQHKHEPQRICCGCCQRNTVNQHPPRIQQWRKVARDGRRQVANRSAGAIGHDTAA
jgi:hypothetical protein